LLRTFRGIIASSDKMMRVCIIVVIPIAIFLHSVMACVMYHQMEMQHIGLLANLTVLPLVDNATLCAPVTPPCQLYSPAPLSIGAATGWAALSKTLQNPVVALFLALLGISTLLLAHAIREAIKGKRAAYKARYQGTLSTPFPTENVRFRDVHAKGGSMRLYLPPLTRLLMESVRDRSHSGAYSAAYSEHVPKESVRQQNSSSKTIVSSTKTSAGGGSLQLVSVTAASAVADETV